MVGFTVPLRTRLRAQSPLHASQAAVRLQLDGRPLRRHQSQITRSVLALLGFAVGLAALAEYWLLRRIVLQPIKKIAHVAHLVASGVRTARVQSPSEDELGNLADDIDLMIDELVQRERLESKSKEEALAVKKRLESAMAELSCSKFATDQHAIVAVTDLRGTITYVNDKFCKISQYAREELIGQHHRIVNSGYHPKSFWVGMWKMVMRGRVWRSEVCNRAKDGSLYWVDTTIVPYADRDGRVTKLVSIRSDITDHKRAEVELQESRERFELAVRMAGSISDITELKLAEEQLAWDARIDSLTGLPNRTLLLVLENMHSTACLTPGDSRTDISSPLATKC